MGGEGKKPVRPQRQWTKAEGRQDEPQGELGLVPINSFPGAQQKVTLQVGGGGGLGDLSTLPRSVEWSLMVRGPMKGHKNSKNPPSHFRI